MHTGHLNTTTTINVKCSQDIIKELQEIYQWLLKSVNEFRKKNNPCHGDSSAPCENCTSTDAKNEGKNCQEICISARRQCRKYISTSTNTFQTCWLHKPIQNMTDEQMFGIKRFHLTKHKFIDNYTNLQDVFNKATVHNETTAIQHKTTWNLDIATGRVLRLQFQTLIDSRHIVKRAEGPIINMQFDIMVIINSYIRFIKSI